MPFPPEMVATEILKDKWENVPQREITICIITLASEKQLGSMRGNLGWGSVVIVCGDRKYEWLETVSSAYIFNS